MGVRPEPGRRVDALAGRRALSRPPPRSSRDREYGSDGPVALTTRVPAKYRTLLSVLGRRPNEKLLQYVTCLLQKAGLLIRPNIPNLCQGRSCRR
jgi:hypothetical protein